LTDIKVKTGQNGSTLHVKPFPKGLADIHLFLGEYYRDTDDLELAREHAGLAKLRSYQIVDSNNISPYG